MALPCAQWKPTALSRLLGLLDELHDDDGIRVRIASEAQIARELGRDWTGAPGTPLAVAKLAADGAVRLWLWEGALQTEDARLMRRARKALLAVYDHAGFTSERAGARCVAVAVERGRSGVLLAERRPARRVVSFDITREA